MSVARFIADQRTFYRVPHAFTCRVLAVSPSWFYKWRDRPPRARQARRALLDEAVREAFAASGASYGSPRVHADLIDPALPHPALPHPALPHPELADLAVGPSATVVELHPQPTDEDGCGTAPRTDQRHEPALGSGRTREGRPGLSKFKDGAGRAASKSS